VARARRAVGDFALRCGFLPPDVHDIILAVGEACNNAAEHGHVPGGSFSIDGIFDGAMLIVEVADTGAGFTPTDGHIDVPHLDLPRGRGMQIMRLLMDGVVLRSSQSGTSVTLRKRLSMCDASESAREFIGAEASHGR
jgi:serine/threonine-protein kinase RsbW